jgi:hypothetical protein
MNKKRVAFWVLMLIVQVTEIILWFSWNLDTLLHIVAGSCFTLAVVGLVWEFSEHSHGDSKIEAVEEKH